MSQLKENEQALVDALGKECKTPAELTAKLKELFAGTLETMLESELDEHLGYEKNSVQGNGSGNSRNGYGHKTVKTEWGEAEITVPRDRNSTFEPQVLRKNQTGISQDIEEKILSMYAKGMTTSDIAVHIREICGAEVSDTTVSRITDKILPIAKEWQQRPLESVYAVVFLDAIHYHVRSERQIVKKAVYISPSALIWTAGKMFRACGSVKMKAPNTGQRYSTA
jgi:putative transposase